MCKSVLRVSTNVKLNSNTLIDWLNDHTYQRGLLLAYSCFGNSFSPVNRKWQMQDKGHLTISPHSAVLLTMSCVFFTKHLIHVNIKVPINQCLALCLVTGSVVTRFHHWHSVKLQTGSLTLTKVYGWHIDINDDWHVSLSKLNKTTSLSEQYSLYRLEERSSRCCCVTLHWISAPVDHTCTPPMCCNRMKQCRYERSRGGWICACTLFFTERNSLWFRVYFVHVNHLYLTQPSHPRPFFARKPRLIFFLRS